MMETSESTIIKVLLEISREMVETRALEPLLEYAVRLCTEHFDAENGYLILMNADGSLNYQVQLDQHGNPIPDPEKQVSHTILNQVFLESKPVLTISAMEDPEFNEASSVVDMQLRSVLCVPLISRGQTLGALYLENRTSEHVFTKDFIEPLRYFASQAAAMIENAMLNEAVEAKIVARTTELSQANEKLQREIAERQRIEQELINIAVERERSHILARFIRDASHQFRTPLSVIQVAINLLTKKLDIPADHPNILQIREQVNTIVHLIDDMVLMVQLDTNAEAIGLHPIDVGEVIEACRIRWQDHAAARDQSLEVITTPDVPKINGDSELLSQALNHLMQNAVQYTPENGQIRLETQLDDDYIHIIVSDTGVGIAPDKHDIIFQRFYRSDEAGTTRGFGLGLSIAQLIIALHRGTITVDSTPNKGSVFKVSLPLQP